MEKQKGIIVIFLFLGVLGVLSACGNEDNNTAPIAQAQFITIDEDVSVDIVLIGSDVDGNALTYKVSVQPGNGSLSGTVPNLSYAPSADYNGTDSFSFSVNDGQVDSEPATINITIAAIEDAPVANTITVNTNEEKALAIELKGSDVEGDAITYILKTNPSNGILSGIPPNLSYLPNVNYTGIDTFSFMVNDGKANSEPGMVSIVVAPVNDIPLAESKAYTTDEDVAVAIILTGSDIDGDTALTYSISVSPSNGSFNATVPPNLTYTPTGNFYGTDAFGFTVNDGIADSIPATINLVIQPVNDLVSSQTAAVVVGQADFSGSDVNQNNIGANTINSPYGNPGVANGILYLPDAKNHRLFGYNSVPITNNASADFVLGQANFSTSNLSISATGFDEPHTVAFVDNKMFVADFSNNRILIWNSIPANNTVAADLVLGQEDLSSKSDVGCTATGLAGPESLWVANGKLLVTDSNNHRVLIWNTIPSNNNVPADVVLGQQNFVSCGLGATSDARFNYPSGVWTDGTLLIVLDFGNHRALIWNTFPSKNFTSSDVVLGQDSFTNSAKNAGASPSASTLNNPYNGVFSNGRQLYIADSANNRVLLWNEFPTTHFAPANVVLGQADFISNSANPTSAISLNYPAGIYLNGNQLIVSDSGNNRFLIYNED